jgi:heme exporter protein D
LNFLHMGGYALYVWGAYGLTAVVLVFNAVVPGVRERRLLRALAARAREGRS